MKSMGKEIFILVKFLKKDEETKKYIKVNEEDATDVRMSVADYKELCAQIKKMNSENADTETVTISKSEYNGLQKALRVLKDKEIQQIDKAKADEHGYTLKISEHKKYRVDHAEEAWQITKMTPFSIKIPPAEAMEIIKEDLRKNYNYIELPKFETDDQKSYRGKRQLKTEEFLKALSMKDSAVYEGKDFLLENNEFGKKVKKFVEETGNAIFEITKIAGNYGSGTYEVTYWATSSV